MVGQSATVDTDLQNRPPLRRVRRAQTAWLVADHLALVEATRAVRSRRHRLLQLLDAGSGVPEGIGRTEPGPAFQGPAGCLTAGTGFPTRRPAAPVPSAGTAVSDGRPRVAALAERPVVPSEVARPSFLNSPYLANALIVIGLVALFLALVLAF